jgi:hypothetical protein
VLDDEGEVLLSRRVEATERDLEDCCEQIEDLGGERRRFGIDLLGGPAALLEAVLLGRGERVFHLPGVAVNRAREGYRGEHKSDRRDALVIADQLRMRWRSLSELRSGDEGLAELRALVSHRRDLVQEQTRRTTRLRVLLGEVFSGMEAALDLRKLGPLLAVTRVATSTATRRLGESRLARWLKARGALKANALARRIVEAAKAQTCEVPAAEVKASLAAEIASEVLRAREHIAELDTRLQETVEADPRGARGEEPARDGARPHNGVPGGGG